MSTPRVKHWLRKCFQRGLSVKHLNVESLETRQLLSSDGLIPGNSAYLALSFVPDGTVVAGHTSSLIAKFDALAARTTWQERVMQAFQVWSADANADVGLVSDSGEPIGTFGARQQDGRFGEIRVAAAPLADNVMAISIPWSAPVAGTWGGDVIINSDATFSSVDQLFAVMTHEAGHVFGLEHSDDLLSPMHIHGDTPIVTPTSADLALLQERFGNRVADVNESLNDNDSVGQATRLRDVSTTTGDNGSAPTIAFGDVGRGDQDYFLVEAPSSYEGPMTVSLRTSGFSALRGTLTIMDENENVLGEVLTSNVALGTNAQVTIDKAKGDDTFYVRVAGQDDTVHSAGSYSLIVTFDGRLQTPQAEIESMSSRKYRFVEAQRMRDYFEHDKDPLEVDDLHANDEFAAALEVKSLPGFVKGSRYDIHGTVSDATDIDFYTFKSSDDGGSMQITAVSRELSSGLIPDLQVFDANLNRVAATTQINGGGEITIQVNSVTPGDTYYLRVAAAQPGAAFDTGTYDISIGFAAEPVVLPVMASGQLDASARHANHKLYVAQPELFHFILDVESVGAAGTDAIYMSIDGTDQHVLVAPGSSRSASGILLQPGEYDVSMHWATSAGGPAANAALRYALRGDNVSSPFGVIPVDPLTDPQYACGEIDPRFCYPDGTVTDEGIYLVGSGTNSTGDPITLDPLDLWQDWWLQQKQTPPPTNTPPQASADAYRVSQDSTLNIDTQSGVLANDVDLDRQQLTAILLSSPASGSLEFNINGSFVYTPNVGFAGTDQFQYVADDGTDTSDAVTVTIEVTPVVPQIAGDANGDGIFDSSDLIQVFAFGQYEDTLLGNSNWSSGDWNGDLEFDTADLVLAFQTGSYRS
ncbi:MAG: cadherin-like domain-containing protein [Planctomycetales bacterium]|nr:cadherin-like domain-containing protein [Planctomycetales bacterium]